MAGFTKVPVEEAPQARPVRDACFGYGAATPNGRGSDGVADNAKPGIKAAASGLWIVFMEIRACDGFSGRAFLGHR